MVGGDMNEQDRRVLSDLRTGFEVLKNSIELNNSYFRQIVEQNESEHRDFKEQFRAIGDSLQKVIASFSDVAVLKSEVQELKKVAEDRRDDVRILYEKIGSMRTDIDNGLDSVRGSISEARGAMKVFSWIFGVGLAAVVAILTIIQFAQGGGV